MNQHAVEAEAEAEADDALRLDLLCAYHVLDLEGQGSGLGGHVTARVPGENAFWCHAWGLAFDEVVIDDLIKLDFGLNKLAGHGKVNPTLIFHARIYAARPDVASVVHTHADHVTETETDNKDRDQCRIDLENTHRDGKISHKDYF